MLLDSYFMLRKEIEYSLHNIGFENFDKDFEIRLYDDRNKLSNLISTNEVFLSRIEDAEGNISNILQTSSLIESRVSDEGNITITIRTTVANNYRTSESRRQQHRGNTTDISGIKTVITCSNGNGIST